MRKFLDIFEDVCSLHTCFTLLIDFDNSAATHVQEAFFSPTGTVT